MSTVTHKRFACSSALASRCSCANRSVAALDYSYKRQVCRTAERARVVLTQLKPVVRATYSSPANWGARIVSAILNDEEKCAAWKRQLKEVADRIATVRQQLRDGLERKRTPGTWEHITQQIGMFSYTGLTPAQSERMTSKWHIYMLKSGRISMVRHGQTNLYMRAAVFPQAGLNSKNMDYVIEAFDDCVRNA